MFILGFINFVFLHFCAHLNPVTCPSSCRSVIFFIFFGKFCCTVMLHVVVHPSKYAFIFVFFSFVFLCTLKETGILFLVFTILFQTVVAHSASLHSDCSHFWIQISDVAVANKAVTTVNIFYVLCFVCVYIMLLFNAWSVVRVFYF